MSEADTAGRLAEPGLDLAPEAPNGAATADPAGSAAPRRARAQATGCSRANTGPPPSTT